MEKFDLTQTIPSGATSMLTAGGIILISAFIVFIIVVAKRWNGRFMPALLGVVAYGIFVFIFTNLLMSAIALVPGVDNVFTNDPKTYTILYYLVAAVGYTFARVVMAYMLKDRFERSGDIYMAGIGISIGDSILYGMTTLSYLTWCTAISTSGLQETLSNFSGAELDNVYSLLQVLMTSPVVLWLLQGLSGVLDLILGIVFMVAVFGAVKNQIPKIFIYLTAIVQYASTLVFMLYDATSLVNILICFGIKLVISIVTIYCILKMCDGRIKYEDEQ